MALKDRISLGMSLPHRSPDPLDAATVRQVAQRAEALGFRDLWVTSNALDHVYSFDAIGVLTFAAAVTTRIRVGVSVLVLPVQSPVTVAHQVTTLDNLSGGRAILGLGIGREHHYHQFQIPTERRVRRFREGVDVIKALWTESKVDYGGDIFRLSGETMTLKPVQKPHPPIWLGGDHPDAIRRTATIADGWMGSGGSSKAVFGRSVPILKAALEEAKRDPATFPISKRVFMSVHERADVARAELDRWFTLVYRNPAGTDASGVHGTPEQVRQQLEELVDKGANHLLLNPVCRYAEQVDALASVVGLR
jgi:alkanesulfonate monooxygenase SsuD/methylene tetrahydromethanopterin reductase-like flavin-dependent oxidoreductase (luciferase family)